MGAYGQPHVSQLRQRTLDCFLYSANGGQIDCDEDHASGNLLIRIGLPVEREHIGAASTRKQSAFYRRNRRFFCPDGGPAGNLLTEIGIEFQCFKNGAGHTIIDLAGMGQVHRISNDHLK